MASSARIDELRKKFDENPRRYFAPLANEYRKAGDLEQAIFICQEYLPQQPGHMSGHIVYGQALYELNRHEEAKAVFETALSLDPENLIALRHLGDIARQAGDAQNARIWYQRVLEADPRNEEIAQIMMSLLAPESPAAPAPAPVSSTAPTPLTTPAVPAAPQQPVVPDHSQLGGAGGGFTVEKSSDVSLGAPATASAEPPPIPASAPPPLPASPPPVPTREAISRHAPRDEELLDLNDFDLGGVPLSDLRRSEAPANATPQSAAAEPNDDAIEFPPLVGADSEGSAESATESTGSEEAFSADNLAVVASPTASGNDAPGRDEPAAEPEARLDFDAPFEADPFAMAAAPETARSEAPVESSVSNSEPPVERATDLHLGLPDDGAADPTIAEPGEASLDGLETFEAGVFTAPPIEADAIVTDSFFDLSQPSSAPEAPDASEAEPAPGEAFVTETMAELYLQQGHLESALDIYRKLVAQRPDDAGLAERMRLIEDRVYGRVPASESTAPAASTEAPPSAASDAAPARSFGGPTIREFLSGLAQRTPSASRMGVDAVPAESAGEVVAESAIVEAEPVADERYIDVDVPHTSDEFAAEASVSRPTPASTGTVAESLGALFSDADAAASDTNAAHTLAEAFAPEGPETAPLQGVPAHRASSELSLDHVFKGGSAPRGDAEREGFSFDQFFSDEAAERAVEPSPDQPSTEPQGSDDIAQFNAWLNGLKKT